MIIFKNESTAVYLTAYSNLGTIGVFFFFLPKLKLLKSNRYFYFGYLKSDPKKTCFFKQKNNYRNMCIHSKDVYEYT